MENKFGLTATEYELMEYFWSCDEKQNFREILEYFNNVKEKNWKKQTLSTFLTILIKGGYLEADTSSKRYLYYPKIGRDEHITKWLQNMCKTSFEDSLGKFLTAFSGGKKLKKKDAEELKSYLESFGSEEEC